RDCNGAADLEAIPSIVRRYFRTSAATEFNKRSAGLFHQHDSIELARRTCTTLGRSRSDGGARKKTRRCLMKILKRRDKLAKTITVRVPDAIKTERDQVRERADAAGFDLGATLRESLTSVIRQVRSELDAFKRTNPIRTGDMVTNDVDHSVTVPQR